MLNRISKRVVPSRRWSLRASALAILAVSLLLSISASAQMREFTGLVESASAENLVVGNRMGDSVSFARVAESRVSGAKSSWDELAKGDRVTVSWKENRQAFSVRVLPHQKNK